MTWTNDYTANALALFVFLLIVYVSMHRKKWRHIRVQRRLKQQVLPQMNERRAATIDSLHMSPVPQPDEKIKAFREARKAERAKEQS